MKFEEISALYRCAEQLYKQGYFCPSSVIPRIRHLRRIAEGICLRCQTPRSIRVVGQSDGSF
jgi:hypothetical protein